MFGREATLFPSLALNGNDPDFNDDSTDIAESNATESQIQEIMDSCIAKIQKYHDKKHLNGFKSFNFKIGGKGLVKNYKKIGCKGNRMEHDWLGPAIITDFKPAGAVVSLNGKVWKSAVAIPNMKPYLEENLSFISSNILKVHNYCLEITDQMHINKKPCDKNTKSTSTALKITSTLMYDLERNKIKVIEVKAFPTSSSNYNTNKNYSNSNYIYSNKLLAVKEEKPVDSVVESVKSDSIIKKSECRSSKVFLSFLCSYYCQ
ncbi:uncharacterized protein LOC136088620 [Hydra vulgaris]|uniref:Uncharacterized protein LOC136088620 n=1 Tax=Hydra vulgaris TaxID=6087 RepID=A0ABM4D3J6_HYDVU